MKTKKFYVDIETGGANPLLHSILSLSIHDKETFRTYSTLIQPQNNKCIEQEALDYNGLNVEECINKGVKLRQVLDKLLLEEFSNAQILYFIGHKVSFDYQFIINALKELSAYYILPPVVLIDTKELAKEKIPELFEQNREKRVNQIMIYEYLFNEKPQEYEEKSLTDISMTRRIYEKLEEM